jgi:hypothetical protein
MRIGSLFSGAGGLDLAVEGVFGAETVWHCENNPAAAKVLAHRWPGVPNLCDITQIDWKELLSRTPDLVGTQRMYDLYCQGLSLEQVAIQEGVSRQSVYTRFKRQGLSMRARPTHKTNNQIDNLECLSKADHARHYNMGCNGSAHKCGGGDAAASFKVDILTAGWP